MPKTAGQITAPMARLRRYFPVAAWIVGRVWLLLPAFSLVAAGLGVFSIHYGLSVLCIWMGLVCFWVDRKHLNYLLITPLQRMAVILIMGLGLGISMVTFDAEEKYFYGFLVMQLVGLIAFPIFMAGYWFVTKKIPGFIFPRWRRGWNARLIKPLLLVGWFCLLHELAKVLAGIVSIPPHSRSPMHALCGCGARGAEAKSRSGFISPVDGARIKSCTICVL